jgi:PKD repeat protein
MEQPSRRRPSSLYGVLVVVLILILATALGAIVPSHVSPSTGESAAAGTATVGVPNLALAEASLARGAGPALGTPLSCRAAGPDSAGCAASADLPSATSTGGYVWDNLTAKVGSAPSSRLTSLAWDGSDGYVLLYGGLSVGPIIHDDTWSYVNGTWTNLTASITTPGPQGLEFAEMAFDPSSGKVVLFGGLLTGAAAAYTWTYHARTWTNLTTVLSTAPSGRVYFGFTTDTTDKDVVLYGGEGLGGWKTDTWTYKNATWTNVTSAQSVKLPIVYYATLSDYPGHGALMVGAFYDSADLVVSGTYVFSGGQWTNLTSTLALAPPPPGFGYGAYLPSVSGVLEFSGIVFNSVGIGIIVPCAWLFSGGSWENVTNLIGTLSDSYGIENGAAAYDPIDQSIVSFGGILLVSPIVGDYTWVLSAPPIVTAHASKSAVDVGQAVTFSGTLSGGLNPNKVAWTFGDGSNSSNLSQSHTYAAAGLYTATLKGTSLTGANSSASVSLEVNPAPSVAISSSANATAGVPVGLAATITGGTGPYTYAWTLGDTGTGSAAFLSHTYANAGTYAVNVTITDAVGATAHSTVSLVVASAPSSSSSSSLSLTSGTGLYLLIGILVLLVVVVLLGVLLMRKPKSPSGAPTPYAGPMTAPPPPPPGAGGPPPGAS